MVILLKRKLFTKFILVKKKPFFNFMKIHIFAGLHLEFATKKVVQKLAGHTDVVLCTFFLIFQRKSFTKLPCEPAILSRRKSTGDPRISRFFGLNHW